MYIYVYNTYICIYYSHIHIYKEGGDVDLKDVKIFQTAVDVLVDTSYGSDLRTDIVNVHALRRLHDSMLEYDNRSSYLH